MHTEQKTLPTGEIVTCTRILGTSFFCFNVWEKMPDTFSHFSFRSFDGVPYGNLYGRALPEAMEFLPRGEARSYAVQGFHEALAAKAYELIEQAFPEIKGLGRRSMGEIEVLNWVEAG